MKRQCPIQTEIIPNGLSYTLSIHSSAGSGTNNVFADNVKAEDAGYRFAFNGKEMDNEVSGGGNSYDYGFRIYNPRLGRFLSVDPLCMEFPWNSTYAYAEYRGGSIIAAACRAGSIKRYYNYG